MGMWKFKSCPRCGGDMFIAKDDVYGWYEQCLQCAYQSELKSLDKLKEPQVAAANTPTKSDSSWSIIGEH